MTDAGWTREKPTEAGWYWMRAPKYGWRDCVMWVEKDDDGLYIDVADCDSEYVTEIEAEWLGPLTTDTYHQGRVAGLREAAIICRERGKPHDIEWWNTASKKEISRQTAMGCAELIEQQAQGGEEK